MATVSFTQGYTGYINAVDVQTISVTGSSFSWTPPTFTTYWYSNNPYISSGQRELQSGSFLSIPKADGSTYTTYLGTSNRSATTAEGAWSGAVSFASSGARTYTTGTFFSSSNPTVRTITGAVYVGASIGLNCYYGTGTMSSYTQSQQTLTTVKITLDVPPTATVGTMSYTMGGSPTNDIYANLTTASVTVSDSAAYYGGSVSSIALTIGNQTVTTSSDGTLSILLDTGGVFTPTVTVTDSRGQTKVYSLDPITVNVYTAPSVSFDVARTTSAGVPDDEGTYGLIEAELTFTDVIATAQAPSVVLTDDGGTQTTPTVTWYTSSALSTQVTWANVSSGDTVYGLFSGLSTQHSYQVSVRPRDSEGTGTAITQTVGAAFYTIDFYAGGHGIAFGQPATTTGFECNMTALFKDDATFDDDVFISLPDYQTASTTDKAIYDAIVALGWDSDVLS